VVVICIRSKGYGKLRKITVLPAKLAKHAEGAAEGTTGPAPAGPINTDSNFKERPFANDLDDTGGHRKGVSPIIITVSIE
jgi:hypothetical protein